MMEGGVIYFCYLPLLAILMECECLN